jgi:hypothetical protein
MPESQRVSGRDRSEREGEATEVLVMKPLGRPLTYVLALALAVLPAGCESPDQRDAKELQAIGHAYCEVLNRWGRGPLKPEQMKKLLADHSAAYQALKDGKYELVWFPSQSDLLNQPRSSTGDWILGWRKDVPAQCGPVLLKDFSVKTMTAQEFKRAHKIVATYDEPPPRDG